MAESNGLESLLTEAEGLIFDCDGTVVQTLEAHERAWQRAFAAYGIQMTHEWYWQYTSIPADQLIRKMSQETGIALDVPEVHGRQIEHFLTEVGRLTPHEPVAAIMRRFHGIKPMALASNGGSRPVLATLDATGLRALLSVVITADDGCRPKPAPDIFLLAAQRMKVAPERCIVFEDADGGIRAALAAGIVGVDVRDWSIHVPDNG